MYGQNGQKLSNGGFLFQFMTGEFVHKLGISPPDDRYKRANIPLYSHIGRMVTTGDIRIEIFGHMGQAFVLFKGKGERVDSMT